MSQVCSGPAGPWPAPDIQGEILEFPANSSGTFRISEVAACQVAKLDRADRRVLWAKLKHDNRLHRSGWRSDLHSRTQISTGPHPVNYKISSGISPLRC